MASDMGTGIVMRGGATCCGMLEELRRDFPLTVNMREDQSGVMGWAFHCFTTEPIGVLHRPVFVTMKFCPLCGKELARCQDTEATRESG